MNKNGDFIYQKAFSRNIGWLTEEEQFELKNTRVAIAGLGGVGGSHLLTLARLGIGKFHIADFDAFEIHNFNRQAGAFMSTINQKKVDALTKLALDINPNLEIKAFNEGVIEENIDEFLQAVDIYVDGLDFFALEARKMVFAKCNALKIPAVTAAPIGMGTAVLSFLPGRMSFEEYFQLEGQDEQEQLVRFLVGLSPAMLQRAYLVDKSKVDFLAHKVPSTPMACDMCAGVAATEALKILLNRGNVIAAPWGFHFDAYRNKLVKTWRPAGNKNPLQKFTIKVAKKILAASSQPSEQTNHEPAINDLLKNIIAAGIRAPSGDNCQPWSFDIINDNEISIDIVSTKAKSFFDVELAATYISLGAVIKNMEIAAHHYLAKFEYQYMPNQASGTLGAKVKITPAFFTEKPANDAFNAMKSRTVNRRPFAPIKLPQSSWDELLTNTTNSTLTVSCYQQKADIKPWIKAIKLADVLRWDNKTLHQELFEKIRYTQKEIDTLKTGLEIDRLGAGPGAKFIMKFLSSWPRMRTINKFKAAKMLASQTAFLARSSSGLIAVWINEDSPAEWAKAGELIERLWIDAHKMNLAVQPLPVAAYLLRRFKKFGATEFNQEHLPLINEIESILNGYSAQAGAKECAMLFRIGKALPMKNPAVRQNLSMFFNRKDRSD